MNSTFEHKHVITTELVVTNFAKKKQSKNIPCLPTISATCSELGTATHCVMFWDFFGELDSSEESL